MTITDLKRKYPASDGWDYLTVWGIPPRRSTTYVVQEVTRAKPYRFEWAYQERSGGTLTMVFRRKQTKPLS